MEISSPIKCKENTNIKLNYPTEKTEAANASKSAKIFDEISECNIEHCFQVDQNNEGLKIPKQNPNNEMQSRIRVNRWP